MTNNAPVMWHNNNMKKQRKGTTQESNTKKQQESNTNSQHEKNKITLWLRIVNPKRVLIHLGTTWASYLIINLNFKQI